MRMGRIVSSSHDLSASVAISTQPAKLELEVVGGLHSGVNLALEDGRYSIGSKAGADIVLRDAGVAAQHVLVVVEGKTVRVEAIGGDLLVGDDELMAGHGYRVRLPAVLTIGEASLKLSRTGGQSAIVERLPDIAGFVAERPVAVAAGALGFVFALTLVTYALQGGPGDRTRSRSPLANGSANTALAIVAGAVEETAAKAQKELGDKLRDAGIDTITLASKGNQITASGRVPQNLASEWTAIQSWFDQSYAQKILLTASVKVGQSVGKPVFHLQAVYLGERPYIIVDNGAHYYQGAVVENGWILQSIDDKGIVFRKEDEKLVLTY